MHAGLSSRGHAHQHVFAQNTWSAFAGSNRQQRSAGGHLCCCAALDIALQSTTLCTGNTLNLLNT